MLGNDAFYFGSIRKAIIAFGSLFKDIYIERKDQNQMVQRRFKVPITFGEKDHWYYRAMQDPNAGLDGQLAVKNILPRMCFELSGLNYDSSRKSVSTGRFYHVAPNTNKQLLSQYNPVPYKLALNLYILVKYFEDSLMILEQITPFFTPTFTVESKDIPELELNREIPFTLNGVNPEDNWDGNFETNRVIIWTLNFSADIMLYPPVKNIDVVNLSRMNLSITGDDAIFRVADTTPSPDAKPGEAFGVRTEIYEP